MKWRDGDACGVFIIMVAVLCCVVRCVALRLSQVQGLSIKLKSLAKDASERAAKQASSWRESGFPGWSKEEHGLQLETRFLCIYVNLFYFLLDSARIALTLWLLLRMLRSYSAVIAADDRDSSSSWPLPLAACHLLGCSSMALLYVSRLRASQVRFLVP